MVFPFKSAVGYIRIGERLITHEMKGKKVCYVKVRMADEIADSAKCFLLACALKYWRSTSQDVDTIT